MLICACINIWVIITELAIPHMGITDLRYLCDEMLKKLSRWLRIAGYDVISPSNITDKSMARLSKEQNRILLTRDRDLANMKDVDSLLIRNKDLESQLEEIFNEFPPDVFPPGKTRCPLCNSNLELISRSEIDQAVVGVEIPEGVYERKDLFFRCSRCGKYYWIGKHWDRIGSVLGRYSIDPLSELKITGT